MVKKTKELTGKALEKSSEIKNDVKEKSLATQGKIKDKMEESNLTKDDIKENAEKVQSQAQIVLEDIISTFKGKQEELGKTISSYTTITEHPLLDLIETEETFILKVDLPNLGKDDVVLEVTEESVEISAQFEADIEEQIEEIKEEVEEAVDELPQLKYLIKERSKGKVERSVALPGPINIEGVSAKFEGSVLVVELPKIQEPRFKVDIS
jgi:HSP20 family protein